MTKAELIEALTEKTGGALSKKATSELVDGLFETIRSSISKDGRFSYPGFGTWTVRDRKARKGRNPQTGEEIEIAASRSVAFKPARTFREAL